MKSKLIFTFLSAIALILFGIRSNGTEPKQKTDLAGKSLFSFSEEFTLFQTQSRIYRIRNKELSIEDRKLLDFSSVYGKLINISIPKVALEYSWTAFPASVVRNELVNATNENLKPEALLNDGTISLMGTSWYSYNEPFVLVQVKDSIYRLNSSDLTPLQISEVERIAPGGRIHLSVPTRALNFAWTVRQDPQSLGSEFVDHDLIATKEDHIHIRGTVLHSFSDPLALIQSRGSIVQLRKILLTAKNTELLEQVGQRVEVSAPIGAIVSVWPADPDKSNAIARTLD